MSRRAHGNGVTLPPPLLYCLRGMPRFDVRRAARIPRAACRGLVVRPAGIFTGQIPGAERLRRTMGEKRKFRPKFQTIVSVSKSRSRFVVGDPVASVVSPRASSIFNRRGPPDRASRKRPKTDLVASRTANGVISTAGDPDRFNRNLRPPHAFSPHVFRLPAILHETVRSRRPSASSVCGETIRQSQWRFDFPIRSDVSSPLLILSNIKRCQSKDTQPSYATTIALGENLTRFVPLNCK